MMQFLGVTQNQDNILLVFAFSLFPAWSVADSGTGLTQRCHMKFTSSP